MNPRHLASRRIYAYGLDMAGYAVGAVCTVPLGLVARRAGWGKSKTSLLWLSSTPVGIALVAATISESRGTTQGKKAFGLHVQGVEGGDLSVGRAAVRNVLKVAIPWQLGHYTVVAGAFGGFESPNRKVVAATFATYVTIAVGLLGVWSKSGVTFYDAIAGSRVSRVSMATPHSSDMEDAARTG